MSEQKSLNESGESSSTGSGADKPRTPSAGTRLIMAIEGIEVMLLSFSVAALAILLIANVIARTFFRSLYFADEIARFLMILMTFVGISYAARKARHIHMGAFLDLMPARVEKIFIFIISAVSAILMFMLSVFAWQYMAQMRTMGQTTSALQVPYWTFVIIVPIGFALAGVQYVRTIIKNMQEDDVWLSAEQQSDYDDESAHAY